MARIAEPNEDLAGKVCACSLGRVGVVCAKETITFPNGDTRECWTGMGLDGRGLWATGVQNQIVVLDETLAAYARRVKSRPSQVLYC